MPNSRCKITNNHASQNKLTLSMEDTAPKMELKMEDGF